MHPAGAGTLCVCPGYLCCTSVLFCEDSLPVCNVDHGHALWHCGQNRAHTPTLIDVQQLVVVQTCKPVIGVGVRGRLVRGRPRGIHTFHRRCPPRTTDQGRVHRAEKLLLHGHGYLCIVRRRNRPRCSPPGQHAMQANSGGGRRHGRRRRVQRGHVRSTPYVEPDKNGGNSNRGMMLYPTRRVDGPALQACDNNSYGLRVTLHGITTGGHGEPSCRWDLDQKELCLSGMFSLFPRSLCPAKPILLDTHTHRPTRITGPSFCCEKKTPGCKPRTRFPPPPRFFFWEPSGHTWSSRFLFVIGRLHPVCVPGPVGRMGTKRQRDTRPDLDSMEKVAVHMLLGIRVGAKPKRPCAAESCIQEYAHQHGHQRNTHPRCKGREGRDAREEQQRLATRRVFRPLRTPRCEHLANHTIAVVGELSRRVTLATDKFAGITDARAWEASTLMLYALLRQDANAVVQAGLAFPAASLKHAWHQWCKEPMLKYVWMAAAVTRASVGTETPLAFLPALHQWAPLVARDIAPGGPAVATSAWLLAHAVFTRPAVDVWPVADVAALAQDILVRLASNDLWSAAREWGLAALCALAATVFQAVERLGVKVQGQVLRATVFSPSCLAHLLAVAQRVATTMCTTGSPQDHWALVVVAYSGLAAALRSQDLYDSKPLGVEASAHKLAMSDQLALAASLTTYHAHMPAACDAVLAMVELARVGSVKGAMGSMAIRVASMVATRIRTGNGAQLGHVRILEAVALHLGEMGATFFLKCSMFHVSRLLHNCQTTLARRASAGPPVLCHSLLFRIATGFAAVATRSAERLASHDAILISTRMSGVLATAAGALPVTEVTSFCSAMASMLLSDERCAGHSGNLRSKTLGMWATMANGSRIVSAVVSADPADAWALVFIWWPSLHALERTPWEAGPLSHCVALSPPRIAIVIREAVRYVHLHVQACLAGLDTPASSPTWLVAARLCALFLVLVPSSKLCALPGWSTKCLPPAASQLPVMGAALASFQRVTCIL